MYARRHACGGQRSFLEKPCTFLSLRKGVSVRPETPLGRLGWERQGFPYFSPTLREQVHATMHSFSRDQTQALMLV